jgi:D-erythronate 2-dehydrogenase
LTRVVVTGAHGFIGAALVRQILAGSSVGQVDALLAVDLQSAHSDEDARLRWLEGSVSDPALLDKVCAFRPDLVFHLASVPGGAAERDYALGRQVNLDATADWLQAFGALGTCPRLVYASSIAVYGDNLPAQVDEQTPATPALSYGTHKRVCELLVSDASRRGWVQGCSLRLPGIVARPGPVTGLMSAFMSEVFWALAEGRPVTLPVHPQGTAWWLSVPACVNNLLRAAACDPGAYRPDRVYQMPALYLSMESVVDALLQQFGSDRRALVRYAPEEHIHRLFASYPPLYTPDALAAGLRHDGDVQGLVRAALQGFWK